MADVSRPRTSERTDWQLFLDAGARPNAVNSQKRTALHIASKAHHTAVVNLLAPRSAILLADKDGDTALDDANQKYASRATLECVQCLARHLATNTIIGLAALDAPLLLKLEIVQWIVAHVPLDQVRTEVSNEHSLWAKLKRTKDRVEERRRQ